MRGIMIVSEEYRRVKNRIFAIGEVYMWGVMTTLPNGVTIESAAITRAQEILVELGILVMPGAVCRMGGGGTGGMGGEDFCCARLIWIWRIAIAMNRKCIILEGKPAPALPHGANLMEISMPGYSP